MTTARVLVQSLVPPCGSSSTPHTPGASPQLSPMALAPFSPDLNLRWPHPPSHLLIQVTPSFLNTHSAPGSKELISALRDPRPGWGDRLESKPDSPASQKPGQRQAPAWVAWETGDFPQEWVLGENTGSAKYILDSSLVGSSTLHLLPPSFVCRPRYNDLSLYFRHCYTGPVSHLTSHTIPTAQHVSLL